MRKPAENNEVVCELCSPHAKEYGEVLEGMWLFEDDGKWGLIAQGGHKRHEVLYFPEMPTPDPDPEFGIVADGPKAELADKWLDIVADWEEYIKLSPYEGFVLCSAMKKAGWNYRPTWGFWLVDYCGKWLLKEKTIS